MSKDSIFKTGYKHVSVKFYLYALLLLFCNCLLLAGCDCCGCCSFVDCGCFSSCFDECWSNNETISDSTITSNVKNVNDEKVSNEDSGYFGWFWRILSYLSICKSPDEEKPKEEEIKNNNQEIKVTVIKTEDNKNVNEKVYDKKLEEADNENEMMIGGGEIIEQEEEEDNNQNDILHSDSDDNTQSSSVNGEENEKCYCFNNNFGEKTKGNVGDGDSVNNDKNTIIKKNVREKEKEDDDNIDLVSDPFYKALYFDNNM